ncbi:MAG: hypothetical protein ACKO3A_04430 [Opitutia bacterium]
MSLPRALLLAAATALSASLEAISFDFTFSDVGATQTLTGTIDVSALSNQQYAYWSINSGSFFNVNSLSTTLTGVPGYDGSYGLSYFSEIYLSVPGDLNQTVEMVGQYSAFDNFTFGSQRYDGKGMFLLFDFNHQTNLFYFNPGVGYAAVQLMNSNGSYLGQTMLLTSFRPSGPSTITTMINASDARVTGGNALQFQGGTFAPAGSGTLSLTNDITVLAGSTGTIDATGQNIVSTGAVAINGTSLTLTGSATSTISLGTVSGAGGVISAAGTNTLSVSSGYTGATVVTGGKLIQVGTSQSASNQIDAGATLEFNVSAGTLSSGSTSFAGAGTLRKTGAGGPHVGDQRRDLQPRPRRPDPRGGGKSHRRLKLERGLDQQSFRPADRRRSQVQRGRGGCAYRPVAGRRHPLDRARSSRLSWLHHRRGRG